MFTDDNVVISVTDMSSKLSSVAYVNSPSPFFSSLT